MTTLHRNIATWAVRRAAEILQEGPQQFNAIALWLADESAHSFHGGHGLSRRRVVRQSLLEAAKSGVFRATWRFLPNENRSVPCTIWNDTPAAATSRCPS
jgi:hypothetical protein